MPPQPTKPTLLLIDKPVGPTSHDIVDRVRRKTGERRVGHAGTLDPFASGLLIIGVGREATRELGKFLGMDKEYEATFVLGAESDTDDVTGKITSVPLPEDLTEEKIKAAMKNFIGEIQQIPPAYAAIKINGKKMYEAAREGKPLKAEPRTVTIYEYELINFNQTNLRVRVKCSSGTYIRVMARDLGQALGTGGYVSELRRTAIGQYRVWDAEKI